MKYAKGVGPVSAKFACGGEVLTMNSRFLKTPDARETPTTKSRFLKTPDEFRTGMGVPQDYGGKDPLAKASGDSKSEKPIKPRK